MQEKDITQKMLERHNDVFSDIVNVLLFGGKKVVEEESLFDATTDSILNIAGYNALILNTRLCVENSRCTDMS